MIDYVPKHELESRLEKFQTMLQGGECGGAIITHHTNLFYFTGTSQNGFLYVPRSGAPVLMIRKSFARALQESPLDHIVRLDSMKQLPGLIRQAGLSMPDMIGFELDVIPYNTALFYHQIFQPSRLVDIAGVIRSQRSVKSPYEIERLSHACAVLDGVFEKVPAMLRDGMPEVELAGRFEAELRKGGYAGNANMRAFNQDFFMGTLVSGTNGALPTYFDGPVGGAGLSPANNPHGAGWKPIRKNEIIFIDYTCVVDGYTADAARMFVMGTLPEKLRTAHRVARDILSAITAVAKPGIEARAIYECAAAMADKMGLREHFMGQGEDQVRFVGHGVGLELDELPVFAPGITTPLEPGMTFAIEPKFVFPEGAVGIENTYVMEEGGVRVLTHFPEDVVSVER